MGGVRVEGEDWEGWEEWERWERWRSGRDGRDDGRRRGMGKMGEVEE